MKKKVGFLVFLLLIGLVFWIYQQQVSLTGNTTKENTQTTEEPNTITIANWNLQIFGKEKAKNEALMQKYASTIEDYDIFFIQEIRDADGTAFEELCQHVPNYECKVATRAGRSSSKEQYGVFYRTKTKAGSTLSLVDWKDFNPDAQDRWERPPVAVTFKVDRYQFTVYNIHTKPTDVQNELANLESAVDNQGNVIILGDLNADCNYYNAQKQTEFDTWHWVIEDNDDTTSGNSNCAYDRAILNEDAFKEYKKDGVFTQDITEDVSDHNVIWFALATEEK